jgi:NitT/TauT family transport system substrate-binding protein
MAISTGTASAAEKVLWLLDWVFYGEHVGMFAAKDFGYFKKAGLDVKMERGHGSGDTIKRVAANVAPFGFADTGSLIIARASGAKVKEIAMQYARTPMGIWFLKGKGYKVPKDLAGAKLGSPDQNAAKKVFPAFANANGLAPNSVTWVTMGYGAVNPSVLSGKVDAVPVYYDETPTLFAKAKGQGKAGGFFHYSQWGVDIYANGIITQDAIIQKNPGLVRKFVKANIDAWAHCMVYMDKCLKSFMKHAPTMSPKIVRQQYIHTRELMIDKGVLSHGLGYMDPKKMNWTVDVITKYTPLKVRVKTEDVFTNDFLPQMGK